jgi:hypothetical protein
MPISALLTTNTFRDWFNKTNEIITKLNSGTLVDGSTANGAFTVNGSFVVLSTFSANASLVALTGNTAVSANVSANSSCNVCNFACGSLLLQPINGTVVNTSITINAVSQFLQQVTASANLSLTGDFSQIGNAFFTGTLTSNGGAIIARQLLFGSANAIVSPVAIASPQVDDYAPSGLEQAQVLSITPNIDTVLTGIQAPTSVSVGARLLFIQNASASFKVTLASANTSSGVNNRFKTVNDISIDIPPGGGIAMLYSTVNHQWRPTASVSAALAALVVSGNGSIGTALTVSGNTTLSGNVSVAGQLAVTNTAAFGNTTITGWANVTSTLQVAGVATFAANVATGNLAVSGTGALGNTTITGFANVSTTLAVGGNTTITGNATIAGITTLNGNVAILLLANCAYPQAAKTTAYTVTLNDSTVFANGTFTVTLPAAATATGRLFHVKNISTGVITVKGNSTEKIDSNNTFPLTAQNQTVSVQSDGTQFWVI